MSEDALVVRSGKLAGRCLGDDSGRYLDSAEDVVAEYTRAVSARRSTVWLAADADALRPLHTLAPRLTADQRLLLLCEATPSERALLALHFRIVVERSLTTNVLPCEELSDVLTADNRKDLFVAGTLDHEARLAVLYRGTLDPVVVPFAWFLRRESVPVDPVDFDDFELVDYGQAVRFGEYEASNDVILYTYDPDYRRRAKARQIEKDDSFGACVRRLRRLRGVDRGDFPGLSEKEIARIERNEVKRPRRSTVEAIAVRLRVAPEEIASY